MAVLIASGTHRRLSRSRQFDDLSTHAIRSKVNRKLQIVVMAVYERMSLAEV